MKTRMPARFILGLALAFSLGGSAAWADTDGPKPDTSVVRTPLILRSDTAAQPQASGDTRPATQTGTLALVALMGLAGVGLWLRGRKAAGPGTTDTRLRVLRRLSISARNEVLLIELDGQRILIGSTPSSIQTLVHCSLDAEMNEVAESAHAPSLHTPVAAPNRVEPINTPVRRPRSTAASRPALTVHEEVGIEEQARGLRALLGDR